ncbi:hypothetical protein IWQ60_000571 [Tieghemiomyces parasiticus]|uniref:Ribosomal protein L1 n=1 Tax=Tieghemiomyces parasiticus TaxID=78921 RepID=A0A9W8AFP3_9FUNG|nr:hypothetical protein IWQ60_000571 [Tieghemiomyces parasiticus]
MAKARSSNDLWEDHGVVSASVVFANQIGLETSGHCHKLPLPYSPVHPEERITVILHRSPRDKEVAKTYPRELALYTVDDMETTYLKFEHRRQFFRENRHVVIASSLADRALRMLGKQYVDLKGFPPVVNTHPERFTPSMDAVLASTQFQYRGKRHLDIPIGHTDMPADQLLENFMAVMEFAEKTRKDAQGYVSEVHVVVRGFAPFTLYRLTKDPAFVKYYESLATEDTVRDVIRRLTTLPVVEPATIIPEMEAPEPTKKASAPKSETKLKTKVTPAAKSATGNPEAEAPIKPEEVPAVKPVVMEPEAKPKTPAKAKKAPVAESEAKLKTPAKAKKVPVAEPEVKPKTPAKAKKAPVAEPEVKPKTPAKAKKAPVAEPEVKPKTPAKAKKVPVAEPVAAEPVVDEEEPEAHKPAAKRTSRLPAATTKTTLASTQRKATTAVAAARTVAKRKAEAAAAETPRKTRSSTRKVVKN